MDSFYKKLVCAFNQFPKYHMKMLLGHFNAQVEREDIFKLTIENKSLHETSNDNGIRAVNFGTPKNADVKSAIYPHHKIHICTWTSPDGKTYSHIDHVLVDRR
jgi:hypothetical protein